MSDRNILEYRPSIPPKKDIQSALEKHGDIAKQLFSPSACLDQLKDSLPSVTLGMLDTASKELNALVDSIEESIKDITVGGITFEEYKKAIEDNDLDTIDAFEEPNAQDINGNFKVELYYPLKKIAEDLVEFQEFFKQQNYGSDISLEDAQKMDDTNYKKLWENEMKKDTGNINYASIYTDVQSNRLIQLHAQNIKDSTSAVSTLIDEDSKYQAELSEDTKNPAINITLKRIFNDNVDITAKDKVKLRQVLTSNTKAEIMSQLFEKRRDFLSSMSAVGTLANMADSNLKNKMVKSLNLLYNSVNDTILDVYRVSTMESMYMQDYISTVGDKQHTRNSYRAYNK